MRRDPERAFESTMERGVYGPPFTARYTGLCIGCWKDIEPGDTARADGDGCFLCEGCGAAA